MPFFTELADIATESKYKTQLKSALRSPNGKKFAYFANHPACKRPHLLLVDFDAAFVKSLGTPKAEGKVVLETQGTEEQIKLEPAKGTLKVRPLKKYIESFYKDRALFVPKDEPEEEVVDSDPHSSISSPQSSPPPGSTIPAREPESPSSTLPPQPTAGIGVPPPRTTPPPSRTEPPPSSSPKIGQPPPSSAPSRSTGVAASLFGSTPKRDPMARKMDFENVAFALRQEIKQLQALLKSPTRQQSALLADAQKQLALGQLENTRKILGDITRGIPDYTPPTAAKTPATLSAYLGAPEAWKKAKAETDAGAKALKAAILTVCDPELRVSVEAKLASIDELVGQMDDSVLELIRAAAQETDDRQIEANGKIVRAAETLLGRLRSHALATHVDQNPFGAFAIRAPLENTLVKFSTDFAAAS